MATEIEKPVFLKDQNGTTQPFSPKHAERLLKYPGTQWSETEAPKAPTKEEAKQLTAGK